MSLPTYRERLGISSIHVPRAQDWENHALQITPRNTSDTAPPRVSLHEGSQIFEIRVPRRRMVIINAEGYKMDIEELEDPLMLRHIKTPDKHFILHIQGNSDDRFLSKMRRLSVKQYSDRTAGETGEIRIAGVDISEELSVGNGMGILPRGQSESLISIRRSRIRGLLTDMENLTPVRRVHIYKKGVTIKEL